MAREACGAGAAGADCIAHQCGVVRQRAGGFDFGLHVGEHPLDGLIVGDGLAEGAALLGVAHGRFQRSLREADRLRGDADAAAIERFERDLQALAFFAEAIFRRDAAILRETISAERESRSPILSS